MYRLIHWALRLVLLAPILLAVLLTALRLALPLADRYREPLTQALSARLHHPLRVETMRLRLVGWSPQLALGNVTIGSPQGGADLLRLRALQLDLDPIASLMAGEPRLSLLTLVGAELALHRAHDGRWSLVGLAAPGTDDPDGLAILLTARELAIADGDLHVTDDVLGGAPIRLTRVSLRLHNSGRRHRFAFAASPVAAAVPGPMADPVAAPVAVPIEARLEVRADLQGAAGDTRQWGGAVWLSLVGDDLAPLVPSQLRGLGLASSQGVRLESWNRLEQGELRESLNRVGMNGVVLRRPVGPATGPQVDPKADPGGGTAGTGPATSPPLPVLDDLNGLVRLTPSDPGWRVETAQLGLTVDGAAVADLELDLRLAADARLRALDLAVADLDLALVARALGAWPRSPALDAAAVDPHRIAALDPLGRLGRLAARVRLPPQGPPTWQAAADIRGLGLKRQGQWPGIAGLDATVRANQDGGTLGFGTAGLGLDLRPFLDSILQFERLGGALTWTRGAAGGWQVASAALVLGNRDLTARARFTLDLPGDLPGALPGDWPGNRPGPATGPVLDLQAGIEDADLAQLRRYLPAAATGATGWLTQALVAGRLPRGDLVLRGPLQRFPFRAGEGRFELNLDYRDLALRYLPDWPPIEAAAGGLRLSAQGLEVRLDQGRLYRTELSQGRAVIADPWGPPRRLSLQLTASGPFADALQFVRDTPLDGPLGPLARALEVDGRSQLVLGLELPLDAAGALTLDGRLSWPGPAGLRLLGTPVQLTALSGDLRFGLGSVQAGAIGARLWGAPVTLAIGTVDGGGKRAAATRIQARSRTPVATLAESFPSPWWRVAGGDLNWDLAVDLYAAVPSRGDLRGQRLPLGFTLRSDLRGLALDLPRPLGKAAAPPRPLALTGVPLPGGGLAVSGSWEPLAWDLVLDPGGAPPGLARGRVTLGARRAAAPTAPGLVIDGSLKALDLPAWSGWWERIGSGLGVGTGVGSGRDASAAPRGVLGPVSADLRVARLELGWASLTDARVQAAPAADDWLLSLVSRQLAGQVRLPGGWSGSAQPLAVQVDFIDLKALMPQRRPERGAPGAQPFRTTAAPALDLRVSDLRWGAAGLGRLALEVRPRGSGIEVPRIDYAGPGDTRVTGRADAWDAPDGTGSHLVLDLTSTDTGPLLRALDYSPLLSPALLEARLRLGWVGGLGDFALLQSTGRIEFDIGPGRLLDVNPGVGRVLGVLNGFLNLYELRRRLSLDIADLYARGFGFDRIAARIELGCGQARVQTFEIAAPSSDIQVRGIADLRTRTYDQLVTVVPSIGTSLALASGMAAGPAVGAGVYLFNRLTDGAVNRLASYQYRITGPWDRPQIARLGW